MKDKEVSWKIFYERLKIFNVFKEVKKVIYNS